MLSITARFVARANRKLAQQTVCRTMSALTIDKSPKEVALEDLPRLDPAKLFTEVDDTSIRTQLAKLREIENDLASQVALKQEPMDWAHWQSNIQFPGLVDELKKIHESIPVPNIEEEKRRIAKETEETFNPIIEEFAKLAKEAEEEMMTLEKRADDVTYLRDNIRELTVDEFLDKYPTVKASIEEDIANNRWLVTD